MQTNFLFRTRFVHEFWTHQLEITMSNVRSTMAVLRLLNIGVGYWGFQKSLKNYNWCTPSGRVKASLSRARIRLNAAYKQCSRFLFAPPAKLGRATLKPRGPN